MKLRLMYGESYTTHCGYEDYVIDLDKFPHLKGKDEEEIAQWVYDNRKSLGAVEYDDPSPRDDMGDASEIVPYKQGDDMLSEVMGFNGVTWEKINDEERYFTYVGEVDDVEDEVSG